MQRRYINWFLLLSFLVIAISCKKEDLTTLKNDLIKKTIGPNIVNNTIEFAYAMAIPEGKLVSAEVEASIPGAPNTRFGPSSWYTDKGGNDIPVTVATDCLTDGKNSNAVFIDTCAATLRYYYVIPEEAREKNVSFQFSCKADNGEIVSFSSPEYKISKMDLQPNITLTNGGACYLSIKQMKVFTMADVLANNLAGEIDLIYFYSTIAGIGHSLVSPATLPDYLYGVPVPVGSTNSTKVSKRRDIRDGQLGSPYSQFIDDLDFETLIVDNNEENFVYAMANPFGAFLFTGDGKYKAFIFVNSVDNTNKKMVVSIKRYAVN
ncbi:MAG: DUF4466 family protein [Bacteroidia bacterium]|nr:DUF4466 family protein [Bacteroidia bacterium]